VRFLNKVVTQDGKVALEYNPLRLLKLGWGACHDP